MNHDIRRAFQYFFRACLLKCPECGTKPIFMSIIRVRRLRDYFTPLDGCPRCGYAYERELGYFLLSIWAINYGGGSILGIMIYCYLEYFYHLSLPLLLVCVISPVVLFNFFFARHSKAFFIALDHYFDPHVKNGEGGGDGGSNTKEPPAPATPVAPQRAPTPEPGVLV
ncbi:MAG: hypothetical protein WCG52_01575 [bacterium]